MDRSPPIANDGGYSGVDVRRRLWNSPSCAPSGQDYSNCVTTTHATWMLYQGAFSPGFSGATYNSALAGARLLGYELYVTNAIFTAPSPRPDECSSTGTAGSSREPSLPA